MTSRILGLATATITALSGLAVAATQAHALNPPPQLALYSPDTSVHTSNGKVWGLGLSAYNAGSSDQLSVRLARKVSHSNESHYWNVPLPTSALTFNHSTGHGTLKTPQSTAPLTTINLGFTATSHRRVTCSSGSETAYKGNLSGRATLITHLNGGGTVGRRNIVFKAGGSTLYVNNNCMQPVQTSNRCNNSEFFDANGAHSHGLFGIGGGGSSSLIEVSHNVLIAHPAGSSRTDAAATTNSTRPVFNKQAGTLKVFGSSTELVTGSGRLVATGLSHSSHSCRLNGATHTQDQYVSHNARFTNTSGHPIVGHTNLTGRMTIANGGSGYFDVERWH